MQRIAISADNRNALDSVVSPHFGRCPYYILVDAEEREIKAISEVENPYYNQHAPGEVPRFIRGHNVNVMLTGGMGGRAITLFQQFGIEPVTGAYGSVRNALEAYLGGKLQGAQACHESQEHGHDASTAPGVYERDEIGRLREEAEMLQQQLAETESRLRRLLGEK